MAVQTLSTLADVLRSDYDSVIRENIFADTPVLDAIKKNAGVTVMQNNSFLIQVQAYGHSGIQFNNGAAGADMNTGSPTYDTATVPAKYGYGVHLLTDSAIESMKGNPGSVVDIAESFAESVRKELNFVLNRQLLGLGGTAANNATLAIVNGASAGTTITVDGAEEDGVTSGLATGTKYIRPGQVLAIDTDANHSGSPDTATVSSVSGPTTFVVSGATTVADNDLIKVQYADDNEMNGFQNAIEASSTDFQGVDRTSNYWAVPYYNSTVEALSEARMITANLTANRQGKVSAIVAGLTLYQKYASILASTKRSGDLKESLTGGFTGLDFAAGGKGTVVTFDDCTPYGDVDFLSLDSQYITLCQLNKSVWLDEDGHMFKATNLRPSYWAATKFYGNLGIRKYRAHSRLSNKTA